MCSLLIRKRLGASDEARVVVYDQRERLLVRRVDEFARQRVESEERREGEREKEEIKSERIK
jgi:hypothetical protein